MNVSIDDAELERIIGSRTVQRHPLGSPEWDELVAHQRKRYARRRRKRALLGGFTSRYDRSQERVKEYYEASWHSAVEQTRLPGVDLFEWRETGYEARYATSPALHDYLVSRCLHALRPPSVLEVGFGNGLHLFSLSARHPDVAFHGVELTEAGVREARAVQELDSLPAEILEFGPDPALASDAHRRIDFRQGSAADLPFEDGSFDVAYTTIALEQMEEVREAALSELARVARGHVVMVEPFRDFNREGTRRDYVVSQDIFGAYVSDLPRYGLRPVLVHTDFPCKVALGVGLVVAEVA